MMNNCFKRAGLLPMLFICLFSSSVGIAQNLKAQQRTNPVAETTRPTQNLTPQQSTSVGNPHASDNVDSPFDAVKGKKEDQKKRDAYSKHYINEDGSFTALIGAGPIHYEKNGKFHDIEHKITPSLDSNFPYANTTNLFESYFGATSHTGVKNKTAEGEIREFLNTQMYWEVNGQAVNTVNSANKAIRIDGDKAYYDNIYGNISAEFITLTGKRKLNYIIPNKQALGNIPAGADYLVFTEDVVLPFGWTSSITESGVMIKDQLGKEIYLYENPVSTDAVVNELEGQGNTIFETSQMGNTLTIKTKVKTEWLLSNERVFPVLVDPTTDYYPNTTTHRTGQCFTTGGGYGTIAVGYNGGYYRGFATFDITSITDGSTITTTVLHHFVGATTGMGTARGSELRAYLGLPQDQGTFSNIYNAITNTTISPSIYQTVSNLGSNGWKNSTLGSTANGHLQNRLNVNNFTIGYRPAGNYSGAAQIAQLYGMPDPGGQGRHPYIKVTYTEPITDRTLEVVGAGDGAFHADGSYTFPNNEPLVLTSGTKAGYEFLGWTGTGSVPATGTVGTLIFNITQNSSIEWLWKAIQPEFHNYGGSEQLAFNNSKINTENPVFRLSHEGGTANGYQIQISNTADFSSGTVSRTFNDTTYEGDTAHNFTFTNGSFTSGTTYYVRAAVDLGGGYLSDGWTTETYSFTYQDPQDIPDWFQTTQAQFQSDVLTGVTANASHNVVTILGGNAITNGSFETNLNGWLLYRTWSQFRQVRSSDWASDGAYSLMMYINTPDYFERDYISSYQTVDLTGVSNLLFDADYFSYGGLLNVDLRVYIADVGQEDHLDNQTLVYTWSPTSNEQTIIGVSVDLTPYAFSGNKIVKFVYYNRSDDLVSSSKYINIDNIRTSSIPEGTITSTPIHLASVQGATAYEGITWNQTLNGGDLTLKVQQSANGETGWTDVAGHTNISATGDGIQTYDLNGLAAPHIRLVGALNGTGVTLHDWSVQYYKKCETTTRWTSSGWNPSVPTVNTTKIVFEADYNSANDTNYPITGGLIGCSVEVKEDADVVIATGHSITIDNEITVTNGTFTLKDDANLVQESDEAINEGEIKVEKGFTFSSERNQYNFVISPVIDQNIKELFGEEANYKAQWYNEETNYFVFFEGTYTELGGAGIGQAIQENQNGSSLQTATYVGKPHNGIIKVDNLSNDNSGFHLAGNPYPSQLDLVEFYHDNEDNLESTFRFWDNRGNIHIIQQGDGYQGSNYALFNAETGPSGSGTAAPGAIGDEKEPTKDVPVGNAFMLRLEIEPVEASYTFKNTQRNTGTGINFLGKNATEGNASSDIDRYWLTLHTPGQISVMNAVVYFEGGNDAFAKDDSKITGGSDDIYSIVDQHKLKIQGKSTFQVSDTIALGYKAFEAGAHTLNLYQSEGVFTNGVNILLIDQALEITQNLSQEGYYSFTTEAGEFQERFIIVYEEEEIEDPEDPEEPMASIEFDNSGLVVYKHGAQTVILAEKQELKNLQIFNIQGQLLWNKKDIHGKSYRFENSRFGKQTLFLVVTTADGKEHNFKVLTH